MAATYEAATQAAPNRPAASKKFKGYTGNWRNRRRFAGDFRDGRQLRGDFVEIMRSEHETTCLPSAHRKTREV